MSDELRPCPFCGGEAEIYHCEAGWSVQCKVGHWLAAAVNNKLCCGTMTLADYPTKEEAVEVWNRRPLEDALRAKVAELTDALEKRLPEAEKRVANLEAAAEAQVEKYKVLDDPQSDEAFGAIVNYVQRHFSSERTEHLVRVYDNPEYDAWRFLVTKINKTKIDKPCEVLGKEDERRICINPKCGWRGYESECVDYKHRTGARLCPDCHEVTEPVAKIGGGS